MIEWKLRRWPGDTLHSGKMFYNPKFQWFLEGELQMSLTLSPRGVFPTEDPGFEMARFIHEEPFRYLRQQINPDEHINALRDFEVGLPFVHILWTDFTLEELKIYCAKSRTPVPREAREAWEFISEPSNILYMIPYLPK